MKILVPVRESSDPQNDGQGPAYQMDVVRGYLRSQGERFKDYEIVFKRYTQSTTYTDYEARKDFQDILLNLEAGDIPAFADSSRFSRNVAPSVQFLNDLLKAGKVRFMIVSERTFDLNNDTDFSDLIKIMADEHRTSREWFKKGKKGKIAWRDLGYFIGGPRPFGYNLNRIRLGQRWRTVYEVNEEDKKIYLIIINLYLNEGLSTTDVAIELNKRDYKSPKGMEWQSGTILRILKNDIFYGRQDDKGNWIAPPLIDKPTWDKIQTVLTKNLKRGKGAKPKEMVPLRDLLECSCGSGKLQYANQLIDGAHKDQYHYKYFYCKHNTGSKVNKVPKCPIRLDAGEIINLILEAVADDLGSEERLKGLFKASMDFFFVNGTEIETAVADKKKEIAKEDSRIAKLIDLYDKTDDMTLAEYSARKRPHIDKKIQLTEELERLQEKLKAGSQKEKDMAAIQNYLPAKVKEMSDYPQEIIAFWLDLLIDRVIITPIKAGYSYKIEYAIDIDRILGEDIENIEDNAFFKPHITPQYP